MLAPLLVQLLLAAVDPGTAPDLVALANRTRPSVVDLSLETFNGKDRFTATGFVIRADGVVVTNQHVIEKAGRMWARFADGRRVAVLGVLASRKDPDLALLRLEAGDYPALPLAQSGMVPDGTRVFVMGAPEGLTGTVSEGIVAAVRTDGIPNGETWTKSWMRGDPIIQHTAATAPGSSGSPVMLLDGRVIGVHALGYSARSGLGFAIAVESLHTILAETDLEAAPEALRGPSASGQGRRMALAGLLGLITLGTCWPRRAPRRSSTTLVWHGRTVEIRSSPVHRAIFIAVTTDVLVDGKSVGEANGLFRGGGELSAFEGTDGKVHRLVTRLQLPWSKLLPTRTVVLDDVPIWSARDQMGNLLAAFPARMTFGLLWALLLVLR